MNVHILGDFHYIIQQLSHGHTFNVYHHLYPPMTSFSGIEKLPCGVCLLFRRFFYLQLRNSLLEGGETVLQDDHMDLAALFLQADFGDCNEASGDLSRCPPHLLHLGPSTQSAVLDRYRGLRGLGAAVAVEQFLGKAQRLQGYGVERHPVLDSKGRPWMVAVGPSSIVVTNELTHLHTR